MRINWGYIQEKWDWLGHIVEALVMSLVVGLLCLIVFPLKIAAILALAFSAGHFHGREKRDYERDEHMKPPHLKGYLMWRWHWDQVTDFWPTAFVMLALMIIIWIM